MAKDKEFHHINVIAELYCAGNCTTEVIKATGYADMRKVPFTILFHA